MSKTSALWYRMFPAQASVGYCAASIESGQPSRVIRALRRHVASGNAEAAYLLGRLHLVGEGVSKNVSEAARLFDLAATGGSAKAADELGAIYLFGVDQKAELTPSAPAKNNLQDQASSMFDVFFDRSRPEQNYSKAAYWNEYAADAGIASAKARLGLQHALGLGCPPSATRAIALLSQAAEAHDELGQIAAAIFYLGGFGSAPDVARARVLLEQVSDQSSGLSTILMALSYLSGEAADHDPQRAFDLLEPVAANGNAAAMFYAGELIRDGKVGDSSVSAESWFKRAAAKGHVKAMVSLVRLLTTGEKQSSFEGFSWCRQAAECGDNEGMFLLAHLYLKGSGVQSNHGFALRWAQKAADNDYAPAQELLAWMHANGVGTAVDREQAIRILAAIAVPLSTDAANLNTALRAKSTWQPSS